MTVQHKAFHHLPGPWITSGQVVRRQCLYCLTWDFAESKEPFDGIPCDPDMARKDLLMSPIIMSEKHRTKISAKWQPPYVK